MKKYIYLIAAIGIASLLIFKLAQNKKTTEDKVYHYDKTAPIEVETFLVKSMEAKSRNTFTGTFEAKRNVKVNADAQGRVTAVLVDLGSSVKKGQKLVQLDNSLLKLQLEKIEVEIEGVERDVNRYRNLVKENAIQGIQLEKAELQLRAAIVQKKTLLEQISKTSVQAPFDGVISMKMTEIGAFAAPGIPLVQLTDIQEFYFTIYVPESDLSLFKLEQEVNISVDAYDNLTLTGKTVAIGSHSNPANSFPIQFLVGNTKDLKVKAGMFGEVSMLNQAEEVGLYIPADLIQGGEENPSVYLVKNGKAVLQKISIAQRVQDKLLISEGIKAGDVLVSKGFINLFDGANVKTN